MLSRGNHPSSLLLENKDRRICARASQVLPVTHHGRKQDSPKGWPAVWSVWTACGTLSCSLPGRQKLLLSEPSCFMYLEMSVMAIAMRRHSQGLSDSLVTSSTHEYKVTRWGMELALV